MKRQSVHWAAGVAPRKQRAVNDVQMSMQVKRSALRGLILLAVLTEATWAANGTWTRTAEGTYNWSDTSNWQSSTVAGGTAGNIAYLDAANLGGPVTINLDSEITLGAISFGDTASTFYGYTINPNGGRFVLNNSGGGATIRANTSTANIINTINADIALSDNLTINEEGPYTLHLGGVISGAGKTVTIALYKSARRTVLSARNTYSGKTSLTQWGTLIFNSLENANGTASALGAPGNATDGTIPFGADGTQDCILQYIGTGHTSDRTLQLAGNTGPVTLNASGTGKLTLTSPLTVTGVGSKTLTLTGTGEGELQGPIPNYDATRITALSKAGAGTWTLKGNNTFTGPITVNGGTLGIGHDNAISTGGALTLTAGSLAAVGASRTITNAIATITYPLGFSGSEDLSLTATIPGASSEHTLNNNLAAGKMLTLAAVNITTDGSGSYRKLIVSGRGDTTVTGVIANGTSAAKIVKVGRGTLTLKGANTYSDITYVQGGTLLVDYTTGSLFAGGPLNFGNSSEPFIGRGYGTLTLQGAPGAASAQTLGALALENPNATGVGAGILRLVGVDGGSMSLTLGNTWSLYAGRGNSLHIDMSSGTSTLTSSPYLYNGIPGELVVSTTGSGYACVTVADATKTGFATVSGGNVVRYTNATTLVANSDDQYINYKTKVGDAGYIGNTLTLTAASPVNAGTLELDGSAGNGILELNTRTLAIDKYGLLVTGGGGFTIQNGTLGGGTAGGEGLMIHHYGTGALTISAAAGSGSGFIAKTGPGTLVLTGASTATGTTRVNQGVLRLSHATAGGTGNIALQAGAALELDGVAVGNRSLPFLSGDGIATNGALRCIATSSYDGLVTVVNQGGRISADGSTTLTLTRGIAVTLAGDDVTFGGAGAITVSTVKITGAGGVIKDGAGTTELSAANDYTGATTVNGGTLKVTGSIASSSAVTVNNGGTLTGSGTCGGAVRVNNGGTIKPLANGAPGDTLTVGSLILDGDSVAGFDVATGGSEDLIDVTATGSTIDAAGLTVHSGAKVHLSAPSISGTYQLIRYVGTLKGSVSDLAVDNPAPGGTYAFSTSGGYVVLQATVNAAGTAILVR